MPKQEPFMPIDPPSNSLPIGYINQKDYFELATLEGYADGLSLGVLHSKGAVNWEAIGESLKEMSEKIKGIRQRAKPYFPNQHGKNLN